MRYFYDTEFLEDGHTIDLISIGIVAEDGREYYAVAADAPWKRVAAHPWLMDNVVPSLPLLHGDARLHRWILSRSGRRRNPCMLDFDSPRMKPKARIAGEVRNFLLANGTPELWADYGAYDHVVLCQLWGAMVDLPAGLPMWTNDVKQECARLGDPRMPEQSDGVHNALADARHVRTMYDWLTRVERP